MKNSIPYSSLFATPTSFVDLQERIEALPAKDKALAYQFTMLAFNLAHKTAEQDRATEEI